MRKTIKIIASISIIFSILAVWVIEPFSLIPWKSTPLAAVESSLTIECANISLNQKMLKEKADSIMNNAMTLNDFIGVSAGISKSECVTYITSAGFKKKRGQKAVDNHTLFRTASIAKPMTAIAIMQLWERKTLDLDVPIQEYLPEFPVKPEGSITVRQLLKHTSGIPHYKSNWDGISFTNYSNLIEAMDEFKDRPLSFVPGSGYEYSTYGYTVLGAIIEKVTGQSFKNYMHTNVFSPAGMEKTSIEEKGKSYQNKAELYLKLSGSFIKSPKTDLSVKYPGGGFHTTAGDLLKFGQAILTNKLIDSLTLEVMWTNTDSLKQGTPYGFGWFVIEDETEGRVLQHGGSQSGTSSFFKILLDQNIVVAALANNFGSDDEVYWLVRDLGRLVDSSSMIARPLKIFAKQPKSILNQYVGSYKHDDQIFNVSIKKGQLYSQTKHYPPLPLYPIDKDEFYFRHFDGKIYFREDQNGIKHLINVYKGEELMAVKIK